MDLITCSDILKFDVFNIPITKCELKIQGAPYYANNDFRRSSRFAPRTSQKGQ